MAEIQDPGYALSGFVLGTVVGGLIYCVGKKFTPQSRYAWALNVKKRLEADELFDVVHHNRRTIKEILSARFGLFPFMSLVDFFYCEHCALEKARDALCAAILELEEDDILKAQCDALLPEIVGLIERVQQNAITIVSNGPEWYHELNPRKSGAFFISKDMKASLTWIVELTGGHVQGSLIIFGRRFCRY